MCCVIILSHFEFLYESILVGNFYKTYLHNRTLAVDYFFMLSGFGIYLSKKRPESTIKSGLQFAIAKVRKIYPAYIFSLFIAIPCAVYTSYSYDEVLIKSALKTLFKFGIDLTLFQSVFGSTVFSHGVNGVCWFLSCLFICYMLCPYLLKMVDKLEGLKQCKFLLFKFIVSVLISSYLALKLEVIIGSKIDDLWYGHPFVRCWYLAIGMCVGYLYKNSFMKINSYHEIIISFITIAYFLMRNSMHLNKESIRIFDICVCILLLFIFSNGQGCLSKFLSSNIMVNLGEKSMYLFLFHYPIRMTINTLFSYFNVYSVCGEYSFLVEIILIIILTIIAIKIYSIVEKYMLNINYI